jgi:hypothetical protein
MHTYTWNQNFFARFSVCSSRRPINRRNKRLFKQILTDLRYKKIVNCVGRPGVGLCRHHDTRCCGGIQDGRHLVRSSLCAGAVVGQSAAARTDQTGEWKHKIFLWSAYRVDIVTNLYFSSTHSSPSGRFWPGKIADFLGLLDHACTLLKRNITKGVYLCYPLQKTEPIYHIYNPF